MGTRGAGERVEVEEGPVGHGIELEETPQVIELVFEVVLPDTRA